MIILHNQHDKKSREFVKLYGQNNIVIKYPECINYFPNICTFPSIVIIIPEHSIPNEFDANKPYHPILKFGVNNQHNDMTFLDIDIIPHDMQIIQYGTVSEYLYIYRSPESMEEVELFLEEWEKYAEAYPPKE